MPRLQDAKLLIAGAIREASKKTIFADISFGGFVQSSLAEYRVPSAPEVSQGHDDRRSTMSGGPPRQSPAHRALPWDPRPMRVLKIG
jgi:hypothetical protein